MQSSVVYTASAAFESSFRTKPLRVPDGYFPVSVDRGLSGRRFRRTAPGVTLPRWPPSANTGASAPPGPAANARPGPRR